MRIERTSNALTVGPVTVYPRCRTSRFGWERHRSAQKRSNWLHVWWGSPTKHCWWAMSVYVTFS